MVTLGSFCNIRAKWEIIGPPFGAYSPVNLVGLKFYNIQCIFSVVYEARVVGLTLLLLCHAFGMTQPMKFVTVVCNLAVH